MSWSQKPGGALTVAPDLALLKVEIVDTGEYDMSQLGLEQTPDLSSVKIEIEIENCGQDQALPDLSLVKDEVDCEERDLLQQKSNNDPLTNSCTVEQGSQPGSSARPEPNGAIVGAGAQELSPSKSKELLDRREPFEFLEESHTAQGEARTKIKKDSKPFSSKVALRDCVQNSSCSAPDENKIAGPTHLTEPLNKKSKIKCNLCKYTFATNSKLKRHMLTHTGVKPFKCDLCQYTCNQKHSILVHIRFHTGERPFKCDQCQYSFVQSSTLAVHKRIHTGEKPYKCDQCQYSCSDRSSMTAHKRSHMGKKRYKCDQCPYSSTQSGNLALHQIIHVLPSRSDIAEGPGCSPVRPPATKTYSRLARK